MGSTSELGGTMVAAQEPVDNGPFDGGKNTPPQQEERWSPLDGGAWPRAEQFLGLSNEELRSVDPVVMNLAVARGIPSQAHLDIGRYVRLADQWAAEIRAYLPACDANFHQDPGRWQNDLDFSHLAVLGWYLYEVLKIGYREDQKHLNRVFYTDPSDLFLNGVMKTRRGTCGNMALLWVVLGRRLGWPVSLACVGPHFICRFDDGRKTFNIEAALAAGDSGWCAPPDEYYILDSGAANDRDSPRIPAEAAGILGSRSRATRIGNAGLNKGRGDRCIGQRAVDCGSDLRALTPRETLGVFFGARARHLENVQCFAEAETDYLAARHLFPRNRQLYVNQNQISVQNSMQLFDPGERGHPLELASWLQQFVELAPWLHKGRA